MQPAFCRHHARCSVACRLERPWCSPPLGTACHRHAPSSGACRLFELPCYSPLLGTACHPCALQCWVPPPTAALVRPTCWHRLPPPCPMQYCVLSIAPLLHPSSFARQPCPSHPSRQRSPSCATPNASSWAASSHPNSRRSRPSKDPHTHSVGPLVAARLQHGGGMDRHVFLCSQRWLTPCERPVTHDPPLFDGAASFHLSMAEQYQQHLGVRSSSARAREREGVEISHPRG